MNYFHISLSSRIKYLSPRTPNVGILSDGTYLEDNETARVSLCPNVRSCIIGLQLNESNLDERGSIYYVYKTEQNISIIENKTLIKEKRIFDAHVTEEVWALDTVRVVLVGSILVYPTPIAEIKFIPLMKEKIIKQLDFVDKDGGITVYLWKYIWDRLNKKEMDNGYRESVNSKIESDRIVYSVNSLLDESRYFPIEYFKVDLLMRTITYSSMNSEDDRRRVETADLDAPLLVTDHGDGTIIPMDGAHRTMKAYKKGITYLPGKYITEDIKAKSRIKNMKSSFTDW